MCLSKAYIMGENSKGLLMGDIASLKVKGSKLLMTTLFGEQKEVEANIKEIDFMSSSIILENIKG